MTYSFSPDILRERVKDFANQCPIGGHGDAPCAHTDEEKASCLSLHRGESVYDRLEQAGWKGIKSPHCMRWTDCFRQGQRRAFIEHVEQNSLRYCQAREGFPGVDSFGQRYWRSGEIIDRDENLKP